MVLLANTGVVCGSITGGKQGGKGEGGSSGVPRAYSSLAMAGVQLGRQEAG